MTWEDWLRSAAEPPSDNEDDKRDRTEREIRAALSAHSGLKGRYRVYVKGSYANNTNVRLNYDVDIAVEYVGYAYFDLMFALKDKTREELGIPPSTDTYTRADFKRDIREALVTAFGSGAVEDGNIAFRVRGSGVTLPADVVPSWGYHRYDGYDALGKPTYHRGACVYPKTGARITNFPDQQLRNGTDKNIATGYRYKRMVRASKKLQTYLLGKSLITTELPSYTIECLVYNVANVGFNHVNSFTDDMRYILATIANDTRTEEACGEWHEVNELKFLFKGSKSWTYTDVNVFANAAWKAMGFE